MLENFDMELFKQIYVQVIATLSFICLGMVLYRYSILYKLRETKVVSKAAYTDALTGKGNRYKFNQEMEKLVEDKDNKFALCFLDLDGFKHINDNMGHDAGDELLIKLSDALQRAMPENGEVFRLGGDEFAIVFNHIADRTEVEEKVKKVNLAVKEPMKVRDTNINLEYSLGIAILTLEYPFDFSSTNLSIAFSNTISSTSIIKPILSIYSKKYCALNLPSVLWFQ